MACCFVAALAMVAPAQATFPGRNGEIAYLRIGATGTKDLAFSVCPDGGRRRPLSRGLEALIAEGDSGGIFSPNGRWFALTGRRDIDRPFPVEASLFVGAVPGSRLRRVSRPAVLTSMEIDDGDLAWSPKGGAIAFTRARGYVERSDNTLAVRIYSRGHGRFLVMGSDPAWSVRDEIAFAGGQYQDQLSIIAANGGAVRRLTRGWNPEWSPDGRRLVFGYYTNDLQVGLISADGTRQRRLASGSQASWSPDGRRIVFVTPDDRVAVISPSGHGLRRLGPGARPLFSPDSRWIVAEATFGLYRIRIDGTHKDWVTRTDALPYASDYLLGWQRLPTSACG